MQTKYVRMMLDEWDLMADVKCNSSFLVLLRQIFGGISRFVANRGECRNKLRRKTQKYFEPVEMPRKFAVSKGTRINQR